MRPHGYRPPTGDNTANRGNIIGNLYGGQNTNSSSLSSFSSSNSSSSSVFPPSSSFRGKAASNTATPVSNQTLTIRNLAVKFPYDPYPCQRIFMEKVIEVLQQGQNALLESPTGTGKTLCLLCGALAWQASVQEFLQQRQQNHTGSSNSLLPLPPSSKLSLYQPTVSSSSSSSSSSSLRSFTRSPIIIYASRTHSQLSQVMKELATSMYRPNVLLLGSREQLCVHPQVSKALPSTQNHSCKNLTRNRSCMYKINLDEQIKQGTLESTIRGNMPPSAIKRNTLHSSSSTIDTITSSSSSTPTASVGAPSPTLPVLDIEELTLIGKRTTLCPYFLPRDESVQRKADLLLVPYNYLVDPAVRSQSLEAVDWENTIVIFDEAHNIEEVASDAASFDLNSLDLSRCITELHAALEHRMKEVFSSEHGLDEKQAMALLCGAPDSPFDYESAAKLRQTLLQMEEAINNMNLSDPAFIASIAKAQSLGLPKDTLIEDGKYIYHFFNHWNINFQSKLSTLNLIDTVSQYLLGEEIIAGTAIAGARGLALENFKTIIERVFRDEQQASEMCRYYKVIIYSNTTDGMNKPPGQHGSTFRIKTKTNRTLSYWCFTPGIAMKELQQKGVRSFLLASGTLSPMDSYAFELQLPFPVRLENSHVINADQVFVSVLTKGVTGKTLNSTFENRDKPEYMQELGNTLVNIIRIVPDGLLVFFPSYTMMEKIVTFWQTDANGKIWRMLNQHKEIILEPRSSAEFLTCIGKFNSTVDGNKGAVLFGVCRGKLSEGIDFSDAKGRAVVITGLPYAPRHDPKVLLKRQYLDDQRKGTGTDGTSSTKRTENVKSINGTQWYNQQAYRAVNQALGRVIRHKRDYGAILLLDERFSRDRDSLSAWIRPYFTVSDSVGTTLTGLTGFFRTAAIRYAPNVILSLGNDDTVERSNRNINSNSNSSSTVKEESTKREYGESTLPIIDKRTYEPVKEGKDTVGSLGTNAGTSGSGGNGRISHGTTLPNSSLANTVSINSSTVQRVRDTGNEKEGSMSSLSLASALRSTAMVTTSSSNSKLNSVTYVPTNNTTVLSKGSVLGYGTSSADGTNPYLTKAKDNGSTTVTIISNTEGSRSSTILASNRIQALRSMDTSGPMTGNVANVSLSSNPSTTSIVSSSTSSSSSVSTVSTSSSTPSAPLKAKDYLARLKSFIKENDFLLFRKELEGLTNNKGVSLSSIKHVVDTLLSLLQKHVKPATLYNGEELLTSFIQFIPPNAKTMIQTELQRAKEQLYATVETMVTTGNRNESRAEKEGVVIDLSNERSDRTDDRTVKKSKREEEE